MYDQGRGKRMAGLIRERKREREGRDRTRVKARAAFENEKARGCWSGGGGTRVLENKFMRKLTESHRQIMQIVLRENSALKTVFGKVELFHSYGTIQNTHRYHHCTGCSQFGLQILTPLTKTQQHKTTNDECLPAQ